MEAVRKATENMPRYNRAVVNGGVLYTRSDMAAVGMTEDFAHSLQKCLSEQYLPTIPATYFTTGARAQEHTVRKITIAEIELVIKKSRFSRKEIQEATRTSRRFHTPRSIPDYFTELHALFEAKRMYRQSPLSGSPELLTEEPLAVYAQSNGDYWTIYPYYPTDGIDPLSRAHEEAEQLGLAQSDRLKQLSFHWMDPQFIVTRRADGRVEPRLIDFEFLSQIGSTQGTLYGAVTKK